MILDSNWNSTHWTVYVDGPKSPYVMNWTLEDSSFLKTTASKTFVLDLNIEE